jgi:hypothetical protein
MPGGLELRSDHGPQHTGGDRHSPCTRWGLDYTPCASSVSWGIENFPCENRELPRLHLAGQAGAKFAA